MGVVSRSSIAQAGLTLGVQIGFRQLTMRLIAEYLGVSTMALYNHVSDKDDLLSLLVDEALSTVELPLNEFASWQDQMLELIYRTAVAIEKHPGIDALLYDIKLTPHGWRLMEANLAILRDAGFSEREAYHGYAVLYAYGLGLSIVERQMRDGAARGTQAPKNGKAIARGWRRADSRSAKMRQADGCQTILKGLESIRGTMPDVPLAPSKPRL